MSLTCFISYSPRCRMSLTDTAFKFLVPSLCAFFLLSCSESQPSDPLFGRDLSPQYLQFETCWRDSALIGNVGGHVSISIEGPQVNIVKRRVVIWDPFLWEAQPSEDYVLTVYRTGPSGGDLLSRDTLSAWTYPGRQNCNEGDCIYVHRIDCTND